VINKSRDKLKIFDHHQTAFPPLKRLIIPGDTLRKDILCASQRTCTWCWRKKEDRNLMVYLTGIILSFLFIKIAYNKDKRKRFN
jgi:hypothetical protein